MKLGTISDSSGKVAPNSEFGDVLVVKDWIAKATASFDRRPSPEAIVQLLIQDAHDAITRGDGEDYKKCGDFIDAMIGRE